MRQQFTPLIITGASDREVAVMQEIADFWKVPHSLQPDTNEARVTVSTYLPHNSEKFETNTLVITPASADAAENVARRFGLEVATTEAHIRLPITPKASVSIRTRLYKFSSPNLETVLQDSQHTLLYKIRGSHVYILAVDLVTSYSEVLYDRMDEKPNWKFRLVTWLPFSYKLIPSRLRNWFFKTQPGGLFLKEEVQGPVECLRLIFLASLVRATKEPVPIIGFWRAGKSYAFVVSHDVESRVGLEDGVGRLIQVEQEIGVRSTWNIPSDRYPMSSQLLTSLSKKGEIGGHDTKHDGRLLLASKENQLDRVARCRERLETLSHTNVRGFRAPLLQHSRELARSLSEAGYDYDSSMPNWEPLSPTSLKAHGIGTVFPLQLSNIIEIPVTMPQDHQLIRVSRLDVAKAVTELLKISRWIKEVRGSCVLLVHPDYEFGQRDGVNEYRRLLKEFRSDPSCDVMTLGEMAEWWRNRQESYIDSTGEIKNRSGRKNDLLSSLRKELVIGYDSDGFEILSESNSKLARTPANSTTWS